MANADVAYGFVPVNRDGSPYNGATLRCVFAAADTVAAFIGDAVKLGGTAISGAPTIEQCAATEDVFGVVTGFDADPTNLEAQYRLASTQRFCKVATSDNTYFRCQDDGTLTVTAAGLNADFVVGTGNTAYGISAMEINAATEATTNTLSLQLVAPVSREDNDPALANSDWIVKFNVSQSRPGRTGV